MLLDVAGRFPADLSEIPANPGFADSRLTVLTQWIPVGTNGNDANAIRQMAGLATPMALRVAVTLGLPDRLAGDGARADELAVELGVAPVPLDLLL